MENYDEQPEANTTAQEQYIDALYDLAQAITAGNQDVKLLEYAAMHSPEDKNAVDAMFAKKAELIGIFTQKVMRGGLN